MRNTFTSPITDHGQSMISNAMNKTAQFVQNHLNELIWPKQCAHFSRFCTSHHIGRVRSATNRRFDTALLASEHKLTRTHSHPILAAGSSFYFFFGSFVPFGCHFSCLFVVRTIKRPPFSKIAQILLFKQYLLAY